MAQTIVWVGNKRLGVIQIQEQGLDDEYEIHPE